MSTNSTMKTTWYIALAGYGFSFLVLLQSLPQLVLIRNSRYRLWVISTQLVNFTFLILSAELQISYEGNRLFNYLQTIVGLGLILMVTLVNVILLDIFRTLNPKILENHIYILHTFFPLLYILSVLFWTCSELFPYNDALVSVREIVTLLFIVICTIYDHTQSLYISWLVYISLADRKKKLVSKALTVARLNIIFILTLDVLSIGLYCFKYPDLLTKEYRELCVALSNALLTLHATLMINVFLAIVDIQLTRMYGKSQPTKELEVKQVENVTENPKKVKHQKGSSELLVMKSNFEGQIQLHHPNPNVEI